MCEYNQHAEQSSDDFVSPLPGARPTKHISIEFEIR